MMESRLLHYGMNYNRYDIYIYIYPFIVPSDIRGMENIVPEWFPQLIDVVFELFKSSCLVIFSVR